MSEPGIAYGPDGEPVRTYLVEEDWVPLRVSSSGAGKSNLLMRTAEEIIRLGRRDWLTVPKPENVTPPLERNDVVVFSDSDPATRKTWVIDSLDTGKTCSLRRGSLIKRGIRLSRLERAEES